MSKKATNKVHIIFDPYIRGYGSTRLSNRPYRLCIDDAAESTHKYLWKAKWAGNKAIRKAKKDNRKASKFPIDATIWEKSK